ncbi:MAG: hypothetical protein JZU47_07680 [Prolixibacteraceae bacterium]|nr:hypothetical protein [Prolixibacteraceae bacterium]
MENDTYNLVNHFRIDFMEFDLFKNNTSGQYKTLCTFTDSGAIEETIYTDFEKLCEVFGDELSAKELIER